MCGFAGFLSPSGLNAADAGLALHRMQASIQHRGPDDSGEWMDVDAGIAIAHRRLSILDISAAGHQPMHSRSGRYVLALNGEIYNHLRLRGDLERSGGVSSTAWRGHSDTETLLAAVDHLGLEGALRATVGMFAFVLWDRQERTLHLARDRLGEKPLYYGWQRGRFYFCSELKALRAHPDFEAIIDETAVSGYLRRGYVPGPLSIWKGVFKLPPGSALTIPSNAPPESAKPTPYWSLQAVLDEARPDAFAGSDAAAIDALEARLDDSVSGQMISDVPLGAFLSGGIDSSTIVALMQRHSSSRVRTFTIGFDESGYDEAQHARAVAKHLGTDHTELYVTWRQALELIPRLPQMFDEPFGDASALPTHLVSRMARDHVTVALSGDGGDESFGGYSRYAHVSGTWSRVASVPWPARRVAAAGLRFAGSPMWDPVYRRLGARPDASVSARMRHWADFLQCRSLEDLYDRSTALWPALAPATSAYAREFPILRGPIEKMMAADSVQYLPDDILVKVDRAAMAVGLETRAPLLDHRVVEFAWNLPQRFKVPGGQGKWLLRQVLYRHVPAALIDRPKMGFAVPVDAWLRGSLREWAEDLLSEQRLREQGLFDPRPVRERWQQHVSGQHNWRDPLWAMLMLQAWLRSNTTP
jgi:asparagine synthase (glutamine-hydrolysing)